MLFVLARLLIFACAAILLFFGPILEVLLFLSAFYPGRAVFTAFVTGDSPFVLAVSMLSQTLITTKHPCGNHVD